MERTTRPQFRGGVNDDLDDAVRHLAGHGTHPQDELETLPAGTRAHWVCNPADVPHILHAHASDAGV